MPGLIDTHIHFYNVMAITDPASLDEFEKHERSERLMRFLQHGITTVKSVGDPTFSILATRAKIVSGELKGPRLLASGLGITGREGHEVNSVQHMLDLVHYLADMKVDAIKLLSEGACTWQRPAP